MKLKMKLIKKKFEGMLVNKIDYNIILSYNYDELIEKIEKNENKIQAKILYKNLGDDLKNLKFGCVSNKDNYTNWKGFKGITYKCEFINETLKKDETQEALFEKSIKKEDLIPGVIFYPLFLKNGKDYAIEGSFRILEIHFILYGDKYI